MPVAEREGGPGRAAYGGRVGEQEGVSEWLRGRRRWSERDGEACRCKPSVLQCMHPRAKTSVLWSVCLLEHTQYIKHCQTNEQREHWKANGLKHGRCCQVGR